MTIDEIEKAILEMDPTMERDGEAFQAQVVMFSAADQGTLSIKRLSKFTGIHYSKIAKFAHNLRKGGVWRGRKIYADWAEEDGGISFVLDSMVATGLLERSPQ